jgi:hypothetical protein
MSLRLDWCSHAAAKYAVEHWHYSRGLPAGALVKIGVWESGEFIGVVLFSKGTCGHLVAKYGLSNIEGCELTRVALRKHTSYVSRILAIAVRMLKKQSSGLRLIVSFADPYEGHHGGIYQAGGWIYSGLTGYKQGFSVNGRRVADRLVSQKVKEGKWRRASLTPVESPRKHRYLMPLDSEIRERVAKLSQPYPKRGQSAENGTAVTQPQGTV